LVWFGLVWFGLVWFGLVWFGLVWFGLVCFVLFWFVLFCFVLFCFGLVWFGLVWFGLVWFGLVCFCLFCFVLFVFCCLVFCNFFPLASFILFFFVFFFFFFFFFPFSFSYLSLQPKMTRKFTTYFKHAKFICGEVQTVSPSVVDIIVPSPDSSDSPDSPDSPHSPPIHSIPYDYLVVCLGTHYPLFKPDLPTISERVHEVHSFAQRIRDAQHVLVVGGRGVGVELVGSIIDEYPDKKVTVVHPGKALMDLWPESGIQRLRNYISSKPSIEVVSVQITFFFLLFFFIIINSDSTNKLHCRVINSEGNRHELSDGTFIEGIFNIFKIFPFFLSYHTSNILFCFILADLKITTNGGVPNTQAFHAHFGDALGPRGYIKVRSTLQMEGYDHIFAIGDIADVPQNKVICHSPIYFFFLFCF
jgi:Pyridine nucleotide-disulphide oxidoreductase